MRKGLRLLLYLILFSGIAIAAFPYVRGAIMDRKVARTAEDFLSRVVIDPYEGENVIDIHRANRGSPGTSGAVGSDGGL